MNSILSNVKVTVVIPTYNRADLIGKAIKSVLNQTIRDWKALIIDDGSTDHSLEAIKTYLTDGRFSYYRMPKNSGICHVLNQALKMVDTEYMVQLDSDDWLESNALEALLYSMEKAPKTTALAYGNKVYWWDMKRGKESKCRSYRSSDRYELIRFTNSMCPRFYRTTCLRKVGGWDTNDKYGGRFMEDRRIMFKLIEKYDFLWVDKPLYHVRRSSDIPRQTSPENRHKYNEIQKEMIIHYLKKWGNKYIPTFTIKNGWLNVRLDPKPKPALNRKRIVNANHWTLGSNKQTESIQGNGNLYRNGGQSFYKP